MEINYLFSPFDIVELENTSKYPIQITGTYSYIHETEEEEDNLYEEEEEEEEEEQKDKSLNLNDLQKKVADFMKSKGLKH